MCGCKVSLCCRMGLKCPINSNMLYFVSLKGGETLLKWNLPVGEMSEPASGEIVPVEALLTGEMKPEDIPANPNIDLNTLKADDDDPLEVVVKIPATKSTRGWKYEMSSLEDIAKVVNEQGLPGNKGHQKPENVGTEFPDPVTHWVGAKVDPNVVNKDKDGKVIGKGAIYVRGVIDKAAKDLKRWVKSKTVKTVSIFGYPKLQKAKGETKVVGYKPLSIDWTPLGRAGMPTAVVGMGEMEQYDSDSLVGEIELDGSYETLRDQLQALIRETLVTNNKGYAWIRRTFSDHVIAEHEEDGKVKLYKIPYGVVDNKIKLGVKTEVIEQRTYTPVSGEIGGVMMNIKEAVALIRSAIAQGETDFVKVMGEMGVTKDQAIEMLAGEQMKQLKVDSEAFGKLKEALGISGEMKLEEIIALAGEMAGVWKALGFDKEKPEKPTEVAGEMAKAKAEAEKNAREKLVNEVIAEKVRGEQAQKLVKRLLDIPEDADKDKIAGEIDALLQEEDVKLMIGRSFVERPAGVGGTGKNTGNTGLATKKSAI